jgi:hypothetical protein
VGPSGMARVCTVRASHLSPSDVRASPSFSGLARFALPQVFDRPRVQRHLPRAPEKEGVVLAGRVPHNEDYDGRPTSVNRIRR